MPRKKNKEPRSVEAFTYDGASRKNIPTVEYQSVMEKAQQARSASPTSAGTAIWTRNWSGAARTIRIGPISIHRNALTSAHFDRVVRGAISGCLTRTRSVAVAEPKEEAWAGSTDR